MRFILLSFVFVLGVNLLPASPITLTPGSLIFTQADLNNFSAGNSITYTKTGSVLSAGHMTGFSDIPESATVLTGNLYVSDGSGTVNQRRAATIYQSGFPALWLRLGWACL